MQEALEMLVRIAMFIIVTAIIIVVVLLGAVIFMTLMAAAPVPDYVQAPVATLADVPPVPPLCNDTMLPDQACWDPTR